METFGAFRDVNDLIRRLATAGPVNETWEFFCECEDDACHTLVSLTLDEFDRHRREAARRPILAAHHAA